MVFKSIKRAFSGRDDDDMHAAAPTDDYLEIDLGTSKSAPDQKVMVKLFTLRQYEEVNEILNSLREGYTIAVIDIKQLRQKDSIELKRAVSKIKKTTEALEGKIAGFGENSIIVTPSFATIQKEETSSARQNEKQSKFDRY